MSGVLSGIVAILCCCCCVAGPNEVDSVSMEELVGMIKTLSDQEGIYEGMINDLSEKVITLTEKVDRLEAENGQLKAYKNRGIKNVYTNIL